LSAGNTTRTDLSADKNRALALISVSRETEMRLESFVEVLLLWQEKTNLVADSTVAQLWTRHIADSLQLMALSPQAKTWVDLGSGGGFPAIPIACALVDRLEGQVHLVESNGKKAAFLREAVRQLKLPATVHHERIEKFGDSFDGNADVVTARALAPLKVLCDQSFKLIDQGAIGLFLKGQDVDAELTEAAKYWKLQADKVPSRTSPGGCIVVIRALSPKNSR